MNSENNTLPIMQEISTNLNAFCIMNIEPMGGTATIISDQSLGGSPTGLIPTYTIPDMGSILLVKKIRKDAQPFKKAYDCPAGIDISITHLIKVEDGIAYFGTGWAFASPANHYLEIHPRSSMHKKGWTLANCTGIIDEDYRGEIIICIQPTTTKAATTALALSQLSYMDGLVKIEIPSENDIVNHLLENIKLPDTLVQFIPVRKEILNIVDIGENPLPETERSEKAFGSSTPKQ